MQKEQHYSVRMRASMNGPHEQGGKHISGGETLATYSNLQQAINTLLEKGLNHTRGKPDFMQIQFEAIDEPFKTLKPLQITTNDVESVAEGQAVATKLLQSVGIKPQIIEKARKQMSEYSGIRGAIVVDVQTGERLDERRDRGIRVSRMDWPINNFTKWATDNKMPNNPRVKEALVLATKVSAHPATVAELCWSDDPEYVTGYVASKQLGYQRISKLKEFGDEQGCRIFFIDRSEDSEDIEAYIHYLEKQPIVVQC
ncbi:6-carboxyhexanoate--CoA ligase [Neobacillus sp. LXY-4]|uniref:6-carboxyhexanoate--CoA ligase n=1 Tax=Neobacillus sp. LXY-4 TaxID=3379826 RepID=UPI003EE3BCA6